MIYPRNIMHAVVLLLIVVPLSHGTIQMSQQRMTYKFPFQDPSLPWDERVNDLVSRLTLEDISNQTTIMGGLVPALPNLDIKPYVWSTECIRGEVSTNGTAFPQSIGLAATFNTELLFMMSEAVSMEVRARWNNNRAQGKYVQHMGLSCFSPVINIMRHPLWGRNQETYGEDPYLSGRMAQHYVWGLQGDHPRYVRANAGCKHFDAHGGPENIPVSRFSFDSKVSMRDWRMTFLPQFKMCVEAGTYNLMCSYNSINGVPACANGKLLTDITHKEWGFTGYIVSDANAVIRMQTSHHYTNNTIDTVTAAIKAGCNIELGTQAEGRVFPKQVDAVKEGKLTEQEVRDNVKPLFYTRMRLGEFDPEDMNPYNKIDMSEIQSAEHRELAIRAAMESFVLLKNNLDFLPLKGTVEKVAIVGPFANNSGELFGDYAANVSPQFTKTPYEGLKALGNTASMASGCDNTKCANYNWEDVEKAVRDANLVIVCLGTGQAVESEGNDRAALDLPGKQLQLLQDAAYFNQFKAPVILLLFNAGPLDITWAKLSDRVTAIMECFFPAQATGEALYNVLTMTGNHSVPAGRLPATWPSFLNQVPPITNYTMDGHTYRYYHGTPLYPFGYGLSYSRFEYRTLTISPPSIKIGGSVTVKVGLVNLGPHDASEVIQVYMAWGNHSVPVPRHQLVGFERRHLQFKASLELEFVIKPEQMAVWIDDDRGFGTMTGEMYVFAGGQQPFERETVGSNILAGNFTITA